MPKPDHIAGYIHVGHNEQGEVVINLPAMELDEQGRGYMVFSPRQARMLARTLEKQAGFGEALQEGLDA